MTPLRRTLLSPFDPLARDHHLSQLLIMSFLEKSTKDGYSHVADEDVSDSTSEHEDLLYPGQQTSNTRKARMLRAFSRARPFLTKFLSLVLYSAILIALTSVWWKREMLHGPGVAYCE